MPSTKDHRALAALALAPLRRHALRKTAKRDLAVITIAAIAPWIE
jgi:hypothetical protein